MYTAQLITLLQLSKRLLYYSQRIIILLFILSGAFLLLNSSSVYADEVDTEISVRNVPPTFFVTPAEDPLSDLDNPTKSGNEILFKTIGLDSNGDEYYMLVCRTNSIDFNGTSSRFECSSTTWCASSLTPSSVQASCRYKVKAEDDVAEKWYAFLCDYIACSAANQGLGSSGSPFIVSEEPVVIIPPAGSGTGGNTGFVNTTDSVTDLIGGLSTTVVNNVDQIQKNLDRRIQDIGLINVSFATAGTGLISTGAGLLVLETTLGQLPFIILNGFLNFLTLIGLRKKGRPYGYVFDSVTKEPLSLAIVRVYDLNNKLIRTDVTNSYGVFSSELTPGKYILKAIKSGYNFPSRILRGNADFPIENLYYGEEINIKSIEDIKISIPLDPRNPDKLRMVEVITLYRLKVLFKLIHSVLFLAGLFFAAYLLYRYGGAINSIVLLVYIATCLIFFKVIIAKPVAYGVTYDTDGKPLSGVVLGVRELEFKKLIEKRVSNARGMYRFILPPGKYQLELLNKGIIVTDKRKPILQFNRKKGNGVLLIAQDMTVVKNL